ncbi:MAG: hypothetical protein ACFFC1_19180 [Promethearchaeota archaeon]
MIGKIPNKKLEKVPLLIIYRQGSEIVADQPEEIINKFEFWAFLKLYCDLYAEQLKKDCFGDFKQNEF